MVDMILHHFGMVLLRFLLRFRRASMAAKVVVVAKQCRKANLAVDLFHALKVGLGGSLGSEDDVLQTGMFSSGIQLRDAVGLTISSRVRRLVSGTKNQIKRAPRMVRHPNKM